MAYGLFPYQPALIAGESVSPKSGPLLISAPIPCRFSSYHLRQNFAHMYRVSYSRRKMMNHNCPPFLRMRLFRTSIDASRLDDALPSSLNHA